MAKLILILIVHCLFVCRVYAQNEQLVNKNAGSRFCHIERYVTDIRRVAEDAKELSINVLFCVSDNDIVDLSTIAVPLAEKQQITSCLIRVYDRSGTLMHKEKLRKLTLKEFYTFNPMGIASRYLRQGEPLKIELDFKVLVVKPDKFFVWPAITNIHTTIEDISLRLNFDNPEDFEYETNMQTERVNTSDGGYYYLWNLKKLTPDGGEFNGSYIKVPSVKIMLK